MIIGVSANFKEIKSSPFKKQFCLAQNYILGLEATKCANLSTYIMPFSKDFGALLDVTDGLILSGGYDICPEFYGEKAHKRLGALCKERDKFELNLIKEAMKRKINIFGICRGLQLLNVYFGGTLYQDLKSFGFKKEHSQKKESTKPTHSVNILENSFLSQFLPAKIRVNSFHHQGIKKLGKDLKITALSKDDIIEAIELERGKSLVFGVQWHPEAMKNAHSKAIFKAFVKECEKKGRK